MSILALNYQLQTVLMNGGMRPANIAERVLETTISLRRSLNMKCDVIDDEIREGVEIIKANFLRWRSPPVELPAESVIEFCVREIIKIGKRNQIGD